MVKRFIAEDNSEVTEYLRLTESDHSRAALLFALASAATPFVIVTILVTFWLLFF